MNLSQKSINLIIEAEGLDQPWRWPGGGSGIYEIRNMVNRHVYIGSTNDLERRKKEHFKMLRKGKHHSIALQRAFDRHGESNLVFTPLFPCDVDNLVALEQVVLDLVNTRKGCYNTARFASSGFRGRTWSMEQRVAMSESMTGKLVGDLNPFYGKSHTAESIQKMKDSLPPRGGELNNFHGKSHSIESREKMSRARKGATSGEKNIMFGRKHSEESKRKMSETRKQRAAQRHATISEVN